VDKIDEIIHSFTPVETRKYLEKIPAGKKLRSKLICTIAKESKDRFTLSAIVEMIHLASLLHDDVIDDAKTRRGKKTINADKGSKTAIMIGDIFYSSAFNKLVMFGYETADIISAAVAKLSYGELLDVELSKSFNVDRAKYEEMIYLKTAALIEASCEAAALISRQERDIYRDFGKKLGIAFQVIDDLLDITLDDAALGKPSLNDLSEGKVTLPILHLYDNGGGNDRKTLLRLFNKPISQKDALWLRNRLAEAGSLEESRAYALGLLSEAKALVADQEELCAIARLLVDRVR
jgi:octaprenyl-diphosphate synthase